MKVKICGLMAEKDIDAVNKYMPDYIGLVFAGEKRRLEVKQAEELRNKLCSDILAVGVFVNAPIDYIEGLCNNGIIDIIQIHGDEDLQYIDALKRKVSNKIIKAVRVKDSIQIIDALKLPADYFLFDTYADGMYGGSGKTFDYSILKEAFDKIGEEGCPEYFLAGGINADNVERIYKSVKELKYPPYCLDISSGAETAGKKDDKKIEQLINIVKGCN